MSDITNFSLPKDRIENGQTYFPERFTIHNKEYVLHAKVFSTAAEGVHMYTVAKIITIDHPLDHLEDQCKQISEEYKLFGFPDSPSLMQHVNTVFVCYLKVSNV